MNFSEHLPLAIVLTIIAGYSYPDKTLFFNVVYTVARLIYWVGYVKHPSMRIPGAILFDLAMLSLLWLAVSSIN